MRKVAAKECWVGCELFRRDLLAVADFIVGEDVELPNLEICEVTLRSGNKAVAFVDTNKGRAVSWPLVDLGSGPNNEELCEHYTNAVRSCKSPTDELTDLPKGIGMKCGANIGEYPLRDYIVVEQQ